MDKKEVRAVFSKTDRAIYMSHLDLLRSMQRSIKRANIPVWYSEGFNPRIYLNFPLALALGTESCCEAMDFYIVEDMPFDEIKDRLNGVFPEGIHVSDVHSPVNINTDIAAADYIIRLWGSGAGRAFEEFMSADVIEIKKHSKKKGIVTLDIKPYAALLGINEEADGAWVSCRLPAGNDLNVNPSAMLDAFSEQYKDVKIGCIKRTKILTKDFAEFV